MNLEVGCWSSGGESWLVETHFDTMCQRESDFRILFKNKIKNLI